MSNEIPSQLYVLLAAVFIGALVTANLIASKIILVAGWVVPAGVLAYSITFAATDVICEIWGKRATQSVVNAGFVALILSWALVALAIGLPAAPFWAHQAEYASVLGSAQRIILASIAAYAISQSLDVWGFQRLKEWTGGRMLWLRNNLATMVSQTVDSAVFVTIAFYGEAPVLRIIAGQLVVKYAIALLDTPVVYAGVWFVRWRLRARPVDKARETGNGMSHFPAVPAAHSTRWSSTHEDR